jgi:5-(carboxyamino)imidazole ribonucleotide synthase
VQRGGICVEVVAPAPDAPAQAAEIARLIAESLDVTGVLAVELFQRADGSLLVNELAMRPHNSGHWTIDGAATSQFEQHLRAVLDWPLGSTEARAPWTVMANVLGRADGVPAALRHDVHVHRYVKTPRAGRKLGHVTALGRDLVETRARARAAAVALGSAP